MRFIGGNGSCEIFFYRGIDIVKKGIFLKTILSCLFVVAIAMALVLSSSHVMLFVQRTLDVPGPSFRVGGAIFLTKKNWLLKASKDTGDKFIRLNGIFPIPKQIEMPQHYFSFEEISDRERAQFAFLEIEPEFNEQLKAWLNGKRTSEKQLKNCRVVPNLFGKISGIECPIEGGLNVYLPEINVQLIVHSQDPDPRLYLLPI